MTGSNLLSDTFYYGGDRNYTYLYDKSMYTSMWIAYPLDKSTCSGATSFTGTWQSTPGIATNLQINVWSGSYNVYFGETDYDPDFSTSTGREYYARGHQIPAADRRYNETMLTQTYYAINCTPQIQNHFNAGIWQELENGIREVVTGKNETVYVVTGPTFQKVGETKDVTWILSRRDSKRCPVPNYYWKAVLRIKKNADGEVTSASTVGFWFEHKEYSGSNYSACSVSVNDIEAWTGYDLFTNLPDTLEESAESNTSWNAFKIF